MNLTFWISLFLTIRSFLYPVVYVDFYSRCFHYTSISSRYFDSKETTTTLCKCRFLILFFLCRCRTMFFKFSENTKSWSKTSFYHFFNMASSGLRKTLYLIIYKHCWWHWSCVCSTFSGMLKQWYSVTDGIQWYWLWQVVKSWSLHFLDVIQNLLKNVADVIPYHAKVVVAVLFMYMTYKCPNANHGQATSGMYRRARGAYIINIKIQLPQPWHNVG